jgi:hypothetical protein
VWYFAVYVLFLACIFWFTGFLCQMNADIRSLQSSTQTLAVEDRLIYHRIELLARTLGLKYTKSINVDTDISSWSGELYTSTEYKESYATIPAN